jgi:hypothetical protein
MIDQYDQTAKAQSRQGTEIQRFLLASRFPELSQKPESSGFQRAPPEAPARADLVVGVDI